MAAASTDLRRRLRIRTWPELARHYRGADLLLGNGFSIRLSPRFAYDSLFHRFLSAQPDDGVAGLRALGTTSFETLMRSVAEADQVNRALGVRDGGRLRKTARALRGGFISAVQAVHPRAEEFPLGVFGDIARQLEPFRNLYTLNYDLCLYHVIMAARDQVHAHSRRYGYNDFFRRSGVPQYLRFAGGLEAQGYRHVYYVHGALFLFPGAVAGCPGEVKLKRSRDTDLLDCIAATIRKGHLPICVSEGTSEEKLQTIGEHAYLRFALASLRRATGPLVIFGASLGANDAHVVESIKTSRRRIAVSVHLGTKGAPQLRREMAEMEERLSPQHVSFFDAATLFKAPPVVTKSAPRPRPSPRPGGPNRRRPG